MRPLDDQPGGSTMRPQERLTGGPMRRHDLDPVSLVFGFAFTGLGLLFLIGRADQALRLRWVWPLLLLALGAGILLDVTRSRPAPDATPTPEPTLAPGPDPDPALAPEPDPALAPEPGPAPAPEPDPDPALARAPDPDPGPDRARTPDPDPEAAVDSREQPS